ncbi:MAG: ROK family protein [Chloroflexota bacterium]
MPPISYANLPEAEKLWLLALDFGGTKHSAALVAWRPGQAQASLLAQGWQAFERVYSPPEANAQYDLDTILALSHRLAEGKQLAAVGVSFGGPVEAATGTVRLSHHVPGWENISLAVYLQTALGIPARVDNDANVAALGEHLFGAGRGCDSLMYITISTGVGGGWILNGRPWHGAQSMAGEIGHTVVDPNGPLCLCGKRGCVERLASGPYMAADAREQLQESIQKLGANPLHALPPEEGGVLLDLVQGDLQNLTAVHISQAALQGDGLARRILMRGASALGTGIGNAANLINPQRFILGGGVTKSGELFWQSVRQAARQTALPEIEFEIIPAALGDDAPLWGAVALAQSCLQPERLSLDSRE